MIFTVKFILSQICNRHLTQYMFWQNAVTVENDIIEIGIFFLHFKLNFIFSFFRHGFKGLKTRATLTVVILVKRDAVGENNIIGRQLFSIMEFNAFFSFTSYVNPPSASVTFSASDGLTFNFSSVSNNVL